MAKGGWLTTEQRLSRHVTARNERDKKREARAAKAIAKGKAEAARKARADHSKCGAPIYVFFTIEELHDIGAAMYVAKIAAQPGEFVRGAVLALLADAKDAQHDLVRDWIEKARASRKVSE